MAPLRDQRSKTIFTIPLPAMTSGVRPERPSALSLWGRIKEAFGNFLGAADQYSATGMHLEAATNYIRAGDYRGAIRSFDRHLFDMNIECPRTESEAKIFMQRGHAKFQLGRINDAFRDFGKATAIER